MKNIFNLFKKPLESVSDEITTKFKTPFFSIYVVVWIIRNKIFVYDLFFNSLKTDKTAILNTQFNTGEFSFYLQTLYTILITLGLLILYYIVLNISRTITVLSEERIKLNILDFLKSNTIGPKDDVDFWRNKADDLNVRNRDLETELSSLRSNLKYSKNELEEARKESNRIARIGQQSLTKIKTMLHNKIYLKANITKQIGDDELKKMKEDFENEFNNYDNAIQPQGFLKLN